MQGTQLHQNKPKIAKSSSTKLPQVFLSVRTQGMLINKKNNHKIAQPHSRVKSKNPLIPVRECFKMIEYLDGQFKLLQQNIHKFSKFNLSKLPQKSLEQTHKPIQIKYQNCLTIAIIKKYYQGGCLKKILHVPTLTLYFLRQSAINNIQKSDLNQWVKQVNRNSGQHGLKILQLFWNMPQGFYTSNFEYLLDCLYSLPLSLIQTLLQTYLISHPSIYNSQMLINKDGLIKYLPFYDEVTMMSGSTLFYHLQQCLAKFNLQSENNFMQASLVSRLGLTLMICYFGDLAISQDLKKLQQNFSCKVQCCLLHNLLKLDSSLLSLYIETQNNPQAPKLIDMICRTLRYKPSQRCALRQIVQSPFLSQTNSDLESLQQILMSIEPSNTSSSQIAINKMNKILDAIHLILQNVQNVEVDLSKNNSSIDCLSRQLGLVIDDNRFIKGLQTLYKDLIK